MIKQYIKNYYKLINSYFFIGLAMISTICIVGFYLAFSHKQFTLNILKASVEGTVMEWASFGKYILMTGTISYLISLKNSFIANIILQASLFIYMVFLASLYGYYASTQILLDEVFYAYSVRELVDITINSLGIGSFLLILLLMAFCIWLVRKARYFKNTNKTGAVIVIFAIIYSFVFKPLKPDYENEFLYNGATPKLHYFAKSTLNYFLNFYDSSTLSPEDVTEDWKQLQQHFPEFELVDSNFPFMHKAHDKDVLGHYFNLKNEPPRVVFIIVESLSRTLSGGDKKWGSFTPFIDSIANHSLYWSNCLSTSQRTFGILPSLFGSLPFGKDGFLAYGKAAPSHITLLDILHKNGYALNFAYGGWLAFDKMDEFLDLHHVKYINENWESGGKDEKVKPSSSWGYNDLQTFKNTMQNLPTNSSPQIDIYLTLTTHSPWDIPDKAKYYEKFNNLLKEQKNEIENVEKNRKAIASFIFADDAIRQLFEMYKQKHEFENTIFIITGDHGMGITDEKIDRFHVPLIIYSHLLKENKRFPALVSHRNIAPTLTSFFKNNYSFNTPDTVAWFSKVLDTAPKFRSRGFTPIMLINRNIDDFVYREYYVSDKWVYQIMPGLNLTQVKDKALVDSIKQVKKNYIRLNEYVCENNHLWPDAFNSNKIEKMNIVHIANVKRKIDRDSEFPFTMCKIPLKKDYKAVEVVYSFDIFVDDNEPDSPIKLITNFKKTDQSHRSYSITNEFGGAFYNQPGTWVHEANRTMFKQDVYNYKDGEQLVIYFLNYGKATGRIRNLTCEVNAILEK